MIQSAPVTAAQTSSPAAVHAALRAQIALAADALRGEAVPSDDAVHSARKALKRSRALLRLLREAVPEPAYRHENAALRDAARPLSQVRDAQVLRETLAAASKDAAHGDIAGIDRVLQQRRYELRREALSQTNRERIVSELAESSRRIADWPAASDPDLLRRGLEKIYRQGRKTMARADEDSSEAFLHAARKKVKYLKLAIDSLQGGEEAFGPAAKAAGQIEQWLGQDHDLAVLSATIESMTGAAGTNGHALTRSMERRQSGLRRKALKKSRKLFRKKPRRFGRQIQALT